MLAGGTGSRLWPASSVVCKQLLPIFDKPLIYYPLSTLMLAGVKDILIITTPSDQDAFQKLLGDGSRFGITLSYKVQNKPAGLAEAVLIGEQFLDKDSCLLILGDNIFHGAGLGTELSRAFPKIGAQVFTYEVANPSQYGILTLDSAGNPIEIVEKPKHSTSRLAVTGLYFFDHRVSTIAKTIQPSERGELEITSVIENYLMAGELSVVKLSRGTAWLDTGSPESMNDASNYIRVIEERTGLKIGCLEEIALSQNWISIDEFKQIAESYPENNYGKYLKKILKDKS